MLKAFFYDISRLGYGLDLLFFYQLLLARFCYHCAVGKSYLYAFYEHMIVLLLATSFQVRTKCDWSSFDTVPFSRILEVLMG